MVKSPPINEACDRVPFTKLRHRMHVPFPVAPIQPDRYMTMQINCTTKPPKLNSHQYSQSSLIFQETNVLLWVSKSRSIAESRRVNKVAKNKANIWQMKNPYTAADYQRDCYSPGDVVEFNSYSCDHHSYGRRRK